jgi:hypothetical protein
MPPLKLLLMQLPQQQLEQLLRLPPNKLPLIKLLLTH